MRRVLLTLTTWEWLILLLILPVLAFTTLEWTLMFLLVPAFWLVRKLATGSFFPPTPYDAALVVFSSAILISFAATFDIELSFPKIAGVVVGIALLYAAVEHCQQIERGIWYILATVILAGTFFAIVAVFYSRWFGSFRFLLVANTMLPESLSRLPGTDQGYVNANEIAGVMAWIVPLITAVTIGYWGKLWRAGSWYMRVIIAVLLACLIICLFVLIASGSRGGITSTIIALFVIAAAAFTRVRWLALLLITLTPILLFFFGSELYAAVGTGPDAAIALGDRQEIWARGIYGLIDFPFTGMSMNGFRRIMPLLYPLFSVSPDTDVAHAHNHLLQAGLDLGIPGLIAYVSLWMLAAAMLWTGLRNKLPTQDHLRPLQIGLLGALTGGWFFGIVDAIALGARPGFIWWLLLALVFASTMLGRPRANAF